MTETRKLDVVVLVGVVLTVLVAPTQMALRIPVGPAHTVSDIGVAPADLLLALTALIWAIGVLVQGRMRQLRWPPAAAWVFLLLCVPSVFWAGSVKRAVAELIQYVEYFFVAYLLFVNTLVSRRARIAVLVALLVGLIVNTAVGFVQHFSSGEADPVAVGGLLRNRNIFGAYLCLMVPLAGALALLVRRTWVKVVCAVLALVPLGVMLAGGPFLGLLIGLAVLVSLWRFKALPAYLAGVLAVLFLVLPFLKYNNVEILAESVFMYDEQGTDEGHRVLKRYLEWQAALKSLDPGQPPYVTRTDYARKLTFGHGLGLYEKHIELFWGMMPTPAEDIMEPDTQNQYIVLAVSSGLPAMLAFVWLLVSYAHDARLRMLTSTDRVEKALAAGVICALVALTVTANFALVIVRGLGLLLVCLAAMTATPDADS